MRRSRFQGLITVVRFNWHLHVIALCAVAGLMSSAFWLPTGWGVAAVLMGVGGLGVVWGSLLATYWAYDATGLYDLRWLDPLMDGVSEGANIHAGFDETTALLRARYPAVNWRVFDFYDPAKHTEISIRRARRVCQPEPATEAIQTADVPLDDNCLDVIVLMLAAHEIRNREERVGFFREIRRVLKADGRVVVVEHLRDVANILAYSIGAWHFHARAEWLATFESAGWRVLSEGKNNLFITTFVLGKHGASS